jgi:hypothetical protein
MNSRVRPFCSQAMQVDYRSKTDIVQMHYVGNRGSKFNDHAAVRGQCFRSQVLTVLLGRKSFLAMEIRKK